MAATMRKLTENSLDNVGLHAKLVRGDPAHLEHHVSISLRDFLIMLCFATLLYIESLALGPVTLSQLWKLGAILVLSVLLGRRYQPAWYILAMLLVIKTFLYTRFPYGIFGNIAFAAEFFFFPTMLILVLRVARHWENWADQLILISIKIALFFIFATVPFAFGLQSLNPVRDLSMWGDSGRAITGFFYHLSPASKIFYTSSLMIVAGYPFFRKTAFSQIVFLVAVMMGSYFVYGSFTRTGWFVYAGGIVIIAIFQRGFTRKIVATSLLVIMAIFVGTFLFNDEVFILRLAGGAVYRQNVEVGLAPILNARIPFILIAIENLNEGGISAWMLGYGKQAGVDQFAIKTGLAITSHNGIFSMIETTGLVGLSLYLGFIGVLGRALWFAARYDRSMRPIYVMTVYVWMASLIISHGLPFYAQLVLIGPIARALLVRANFRNQLMPNSSGN